MNLSNSIFDVDDIEINRVNKKNMLLMLVIILLIGALFLISKDNYYENNLVNGDGEIILLVDKHMVNFVKEKKTININEIKTDYSINKIIDQGNICYVSINLNTSIENILTDKYKILLGKETMFEYIIRIIRKIS